MLLPRRTLMPRILMASIQSYPCLHVCRPACAHSPLVMQCLGPSPNRNLFIKTPYSLFDVILKPFLFVVPGLPGSWHTTICSCMPVVWPWKFHVGSIHNLMWPKCLLTRGNYLRALLEQLWSQVTIIKKALQIASFDSKLDKAGIPAWRILL
jgi:hypothetical protein